MDLIATERWTQHPWFARPGPRAAGRGFDAALPRARLRRPPAGGEGPAARPAHRRRARQHLRLRGAVPRRDLAAKPAGGRSARPKLAAAGRRRSASVLAEAIEAGGSTLRDYAAADGALGYFQHGFAVYGREGEPCLDAGLRAA